ncbi:MAG TPA: hypothetical protein VFZ43_11065 [Anaerolineales bacterium]
MKDRWDAIWRKLRAHTMPHDVFEELISAYSSPNRFYHNLTHIEDCLSLFEQAKFLAAHPEELELAIWFHDAVYDTRKSDNEQKSAKWAEAVISQAGLTKEIAERVSHSILATRHNMEVTDSDAQVLVDVDLSILGREPHIFWRYEKNIRKEYAWVPEDLFRQKRIEVLRGLLGRRSIYYHEEYREQYESRARVNVEQAIELLSDATKAA